LGIFLLPYQKYFLYLDSKPGYSKNDLSYYLKDKMWEWNVISKMKSKPRTNDEIKAQIDIEYEQYLQQEKLKTKTKTGETP
jgi:hypothetical protein